MPASTKFQSPRGGVVVHTYTKQVLPNNKESNISLYRKKERENFCLFDLTFFVQNVIFQRFRICGFR